jgi:hypothetical protein
LSKIKITRGTFSAAGRVCFTGGAAVFQGRKWSGEGVSLGGRRGFYGCERVSLGKNHMWFSKKSHVVLRIFTCGFSKSHMWFYPRQAGIVPKKGWNATMKSALGDHFDTRKNIRRYWYG